MKPGEILCHIPELGIHLHAPHADTDTAFMTCRPKDVDLTAKQLAQLGVAMIRAAVAIRAPSGARSLLRALETALADWRPADE